MSGSWLAGEVLVTDGPYLEAKEYVGGLWVLEAAGLDEALAWGRKAAVACRAPVEVRPIHYGSVGSVQSFRVPKPGAVTGYNVSDISDELRALQPWETHRTRRRAGGWGVWSSTHARYPSDTIGSMESWNAFERAEPELAETGNALLHQRGDGEGFLTTVAANGTPRIHPLNVGVRDGRLLVFIQGGSAKARDLEANPHYALHAHMDPSAPHEFMVRGEARLVTDAAVRQATAADWFFTVSDAYPLYELLIEHVLLGERDNADDWPPRYRSWRSA